MSVSRDQRTNITLPFFVGLGRLFRIVMVFSLLGGWIQERWLVNHIKTRIEFHGYRVVKQKPRPNSQACSIYKQQKYLKMILHLTHKISRSTNELLDAK